MVDTTVSTTAALSTAMNTASLGDTIYLSPGVYAGLDKFNTVRPGMVTIRSLDPNNRAVLNYFRLNGCQNFTFTDLEIDLTGSSKAIEVWTCTDVLFTNCYVHGPVSGGILDVIDNLVTGFDARTSTRLTISNCRFYRLYNGIGNNANITVTYENNHFHDIRCDGINGAAFTGAVIRGNYFTDFYPQGDVGGAGDHPDACQIFLNSANAGSSNILIENNKVVRGSGHQIQGFTCFREDVTKSVTGITIRGNVLVGASFNGIYVAGGLNVLIEDNVLAPFPDEASNISVMNCTSPIVRNNRTPSVATTGSTGVTNTGNTTGAWTTINVTPTPGTLTGVELLSLRTVSTSETPTKAETLATVKYTDTKLRAVKLKADIVPESVIVSGTQVAYNTQYTGGLKTTVLRNPVVNAALFPAGTNVTSGPNQIQFPETGPDFELTDFDFTGYEVSFRGANAILRRCRFANNGGGRLLVTEGDSEVTVYNTTFDGTGMQYAHQAIVVCGGGTKLTEYDCLHVKSPKCHVDAWGQYRATRTWYGAFGWNPGPDPHQEGIFFRQGTGHQLTDCAFDISSFDSPEGETGIWYLEGEYNPTSLLATRIVMYGALANNVAYPIQLAAKNYAVSLTISGIAIQSGPSGYLGVTEIGGNQVTVSETNAYAYDTGAAIDLNIT